MQDLELVYFATCTTCEITTWIFKEYIRVFYPCCTQEESSRLWKVDLPRVWHKGGTWINHVNYQPVLHNANLVENLCFVCWVVIIREPQRNQNEPEKVGSLWLGTPLWIYNSRPYQTKNFLALLKTVDLKLFYIF